MSAGDVAVVTGAATGIGKAIAARLAADGTTVVVNHPHTPEPAESVVAGLRSMGGTATAMAADVSDRAQFATMIDHVVSEYGRWTVLVNNAALAITKPFPQITAEDFERSFAVNVRGVFHGLQLAWDRLQDGGRIITLSSATTGLMLPGYSVYDATKGAVEQLTRILCKEFGPRGITVNAVAPGATETETYRQDKDRDFLAGLERLSAFGRLGRPSEIADVVAFLAGPQAGWITGQILRVNGGTV